MNEDKGGQMSKDDLDFDELHKQVSKLMDQASKPKAKKAKVHTEAKPATSPASEPKPAEKPEEKKPEPTSAAETSGDNGTPILVKRPAPRLVPPKRKGMAMDIVQHKTPALAPPSARPARTAPTLQPTQRVMPEPPRPREAEPVAPAPRPDDVPEDTLASLNMQTDTPPTTDTKPAVPEPHPQAASVFPDPLDVHGFKDDTEKPAEQPAPPAQTGEEPAEPETAEAPSMQAEPTGPFVNAKVEKRPLGAFADATPPAEATPAAAEEPAETPAAPEDAAKQRAAEAVLATPPPPKELSPEVVAAESAEPEFTPDMNSLRQMSIPPQYKTADKEPGHETHQIFDTKDYHPPITPAKPPRKKSRVGMVVTLILVILVVVAGVGAYFVMTGSIDLNNLF